MRKLKKGILSGRMTVFNYKCYAANISGDICILTRDDYKGDAIYRIINSCNDIFIGDGYAGGGGLHPMDLTNKIIELMPETQIYEFDSAKEMFQWIVDKLEE